VVIHPGAEERHLVLGAHVALGERAQLRVHLRLRQARIEIQAVGEPQIRGYVGEQLGDAVDADRREHLGAVGVGGGGIAAHDNVPS
jgi:hypothetical protein